jgi:hypothetical protein
VSDLSTEELVGLLEARAKAGNVRAIQLLLERRWEKVTDDDKPADPFDALDADVIPIRRQDGA